MTGNGTMTTSIFMFVTSTQVMSVIDGRVIIESARAVKTRT